MNARTSGKPIEGTPQMNDHPILDEYVPFVRRVLSECNDSKLSAAGREGRIKFLVEEEVTQETLEIYDVLIESLRSDNRPPNAEVPMQQLRDALAPYVGETLLKTMLRMPGRAYEIYVNPRTVSVVQVAEIPDAVENASPINMHLEWFETVEDDPQYRSWLEKMCSLNSSTHPVLSHLEPSITSTCTSRCSKTPCSGESSPRDSGKQT